MAGQPTPQIIIQDACIVDPKHYKLEHEDEKVRVIRIRYGPREKSPMHSHKAAMTVSLTDSHMRLSYPDGTSDDIIMNAGQVLATPAVEHAAENLREQPMEAVAIEVKV